MKRLTIIVLLIYSTVSCYGQSFFSKDEIRKHNIKKVFINGPDSRYYDIQEFDTTGNLIRVSNVNDGRNPFTTEELIYESSLLREKRIYQSYAPDNLQTIRYFYDEKGLLRREEDSISCKICAIPKRITEYVYNSQDQLEMEMYKSGDFNLQKKYYYEGGRLTKMEATSDSFRIKDYVTHYYYDDKQRLIKESLYNYSSNISLTTNYTYKEGRIIEMKSKRGRNIYYKLRYLYNTDGLLSKVISKQESHESDSYYTTETYFNFER